MRDRHIVGSTANEVYSRGLDNPAAGMRYNIINVGEELRDPDDGDLLGYIGHFAALGEVIQSSGAVVPGKDSIFDMRREEPLTHMRVIETGREIMQGDRVFPAQADIGADFVLSAPSNEAILGQIVAIVDGIYVAGKYQVVAINRGKRHGLAPGNLLGVFYRGEEVRDRFDRQNWAGLHRELRPGAPAGRAQRHDPVVHRERPHELWPGDAVVAGDPPRGLHREPAARPPGHSGSTNFAR